MVNTNIYYPGPEGPGPAVGTELPLTFHHPNDSGNTDPLNCLSNFFGIRKRGLNKASVGTPSN